MIRRLRYRLGARLLRPWLVADMQHWNKLATTYVSREKVWDAMSRRDAIVPFVNGSARARYPKASATGVGQ